MQKWMLWMAGSMWIVLTSGIVFIGKSVISNEHMSIQRHQMLVDKISNIDVRVAKIESNRFTASDAQSLTEAIMQKLPPTWLIEDVKENRDAIKRLQHRRYSNYGPEEK